MKFQGIRYVFLFSGEKLLDYIFIQKLSNTSDVTNNDACDRRFATILLIDCERYRFQVSYVVTLKEVTWRR